MDSDYFSNLFDQITFSGLSAGSIIAFGVAALLLCVSAFVSASEVAFFSLSPGDLNTIREGKTSSDKTIEHLLGRSEYLLASILIANNFVNVSVVMLCTYAINAWIDFSAVPALGFVLETIILTFLLLLFGEIMPKIYAQRDPLHFVYLSASVLSGIERFCRPLSKLLVGSTFFINKTKGKKKYDFSVDQLSKALELTSAEIPEEKEMLAEIIKFYNKTADEIMTSRLDMDDIDIKINFRGVIDFIVQSGYSRIPVYADTEDNIKGILYIKDLLPYIDKPDTFRWQSLIRPAYFVPETKKIDDLLEEFRTNKIHMAIVVDEFGGTSGIVTMEDILEEIVGEISDEYDEDQKQYISLADGSYIFEAKILLTDFFRVIAAEESDFGKLTEGVETLAGLLLEIKGDFPCRREIIEQGRYRFQILEMDNRRIQKVKFNYIPDAERANEES
ncbi:gliding motility-associated protein GldE [Parabacteroides sp. 52]|uniref:gliding motility-associated protein GldE n=1 Tax=unclassified Parabacteroides TaxID=2649774 RepID=UPI0013D0E8CE|nr:MULTISPECIES: gliding motility-associated protein GldE [unclassified Parabacteroides]MDH6535565.1 putative hemolysin [Parabacteroides sp. PM5-20]NDV56044.1 gliding motility-associated protein GldE [Parabacteroides sp. 52]